MTEIEITLTVSPDDGTRVCSAVLGRASRCFEGHFPGRPVLPGIAHLAIVSRAVALLWGSGPTLVEVGMLRLRRPLGPGDAVEVRAGEPDAQGHVRFELRLHGLVASHGIARFERREG